MHFIHQAMQLSYTVRSPEYAPAHHLHQQREFAHLAVTTVKWLNIFSSSFLQWVNNETAHHNQHLVQNSMDKAWMTELLFYDCGIIRKNIAKCKEGGVCLAVSTFKMTDFRKG